MAAGTGRGAQPEGESQATPVRHSLSLKAPTLCKQEASLTVHLTLLGVQGLPAQVPVLRLWILHLREDVHPPGPCAGGAPPSLLSVDTPFTRH